MDSTPVDTATLHLPTNKVTHATTHRATNRSTYSNPSPHSTTNRDAHNFPPYNIPTNPNSLSTTIPRTNSTTNNRITNSSAY